MCTRVLVFMMLGMVSVAHGADRPDRPDLLRPLTDVTPTSVVLQYFTSSPGETRVQVRERDDEWRVVEGRTEKTTYHRITIEHLTPGKRYFYRIFDSDYSPDDDARHWGAEKPWRRKFAVSTEAGEGKRTILRVPVKVLLMPNVLNVASAHDDSGAITPRPEKMSESDLAMIRHEYAIASRYFFINSNC